MAASHIFKVVFVNQGKVYEIYARKVSHGSLFGFIEVEELVFGERSAVVVDPSEEKVKAEFEGVKRTYLPLHSVLRIDEVRQQGISKISAFEGSNVTPFPMPMYTPGDKKQGAGPGLEVLGGREASHPGPAPAPGRHLPAIIRARPPLRESRRLRESPRPSRCSYCTARLHSPTFATPDSLPRSKRGFAQSKR